MESKMKYLGWQNGWGEKEPAVWRECLNKNHHNDGTMERDYKGNHHTVVTCKVCGYYYDVDSS
jgi:hypothetical protein